MMTQIKHLDDGRVLYEHDGTTCEAVTAAVRSRANLARADLARAYLVGANLARADLARADLRGADLHGAYLGDADLHGAYLVGANLARADLARADLRGADLHGANLGDADLGGANLGGSTMPDCRSWEAYRADPLAGICDDPEARARAIAAWGKHEWGKCPMSVAHGYKSIGDVPAERRIAVAAFVAIFDALLLPAG